MKKSKAFLAITLAAALVVVCICAPTFSWFTRPTTHESGNSLVLDDYSIKAYNGNDVSFVTYKYDPTSSAEDKYTIGCDNTGLDDAKVASGEDITRDYYCTTITNGSTTKEQNVSLFANLLTTNTVGFALGVNGPTRSYRDYTERTIVSTTESYTDTMRIYFERPTDNYVGSHDWWTGRYGIKYWNSSGTSGNSRFDPCPDTNNVYYADISKYATSFYVYEGTNDEATGSARTPIINLPSGVNCQIYTQKVIAWNETTDNDNINYTLSEVQGANIIKYYNTIELAPGTTFNAGLTWPDSKGTMSYSSADTSVFEVDSNGVITAKSVGAKVKLTSTANGETHKDQKSVDTLVTVSDGDKTEKNVPIAKNIQIPIDNAATTSKAENVVKVYWYIEKTGATALNYSIDRVYLGM